MDTFGEFHENSSFWVNFHGHVLGEFSWTFLVNFHGHFLTASGLRNLFVGFVVVVLVSILPLMS